jgi:hypothetical protein
MITPPAHIKPHKVAGRDVTMPGKRRIPAKASAVGVTMAKSRVRANPAR